MLGTIGMFMAGTSVLSSRSHNKGNLVVGFSVDYTIHLGHMFVAAGREHDLGNRLDRFSFAIRKMGGTVVVGAVTTLGAGLFMLPCKLVSFYKLGLLLITRSSSHYSLPLCWSCRSCAASRQGPPLRPVRVSAPERAETDDV